MWRRHARFGSFAFDLGIYDQAVWLLANGEHFVTVRGLPVFGHHANVAFFLFVPAYWLGAGPHLLNTAMVVSQAVGAVPVYLLSRQRHLSAPLAVGLALAYLFHPTLQFLAWETFHPEVMAITPLLFAWWLAARHQWHWMALALVYAVAWKEDVALFVAAFGVVLAIRGHRRVGIVTAVAAAAWFLFVNRWLLPTAAGTTHAFYDTFFGDLGSNPIEIAHTALVHPTRVLDRLVAPEALSYYWHLIAPYAVAPLLAPLALLAGLPQLLVNVLSVHSFTRDPIFHYAALPLAALTAAVVEAVARIRRRWRPAVVATVVVAAAAATVGWGVSPLGVRFDDGWWPSRQPELNAARAAAVDAVPPDAGVAATYQLVPHLTHRAEVYDWPNPFVPTNWGAENAPIPETLTPDWLVLDTNTFDPADRNLLARLLREEFDLVSSDEGVVVARRSGAEKARR